MPAPSPTVLALHTSKSHTFSKAPANSINLLPGLGVEGDAHCGATVKHRYSARRDPTQPNLRQVHLIQAELYEKLALEGFRVDPGQIGENITTHGLDLLALPTASRLHVGATAVIELTGLRTPCVLIERFQKGLLNAVRIRDDEGRLAPRAGVMGIVLTGGFVYPGDAITVVLPEGPHRRLAAI